MDDKTASNAPRGLRLIDLAALVAGFSLAGLPIRTLLPVSVAPNLAEALFPGFEFLWLSLAMTGPLVLLIDRRTAPDSGQDSRYTRTEPVWLLIRRLLDRPDLAGLADETAVRPDARHPARPAGPHLAPLRPPP